MAVDAREFNLVTDVVGSFGRGFGAGQNIQQSLLRNQLLQQQVQQQQQQVNTANQMRELLMQFNTPQNEQQSLLAEQTANFNPVGQDQLSQQIRGEQPLSEAQLKAKARQIDPLVADKFFKAMGIDDATKREDFGRFAIGAMNQPEPIQNQMIQRRIEQIEANRGDATDTRDLLNIPIQNRAKALETIALSSLSVKDAIGAQQRGQQLAKTGGLTTGQRDFQSLSDAANLSKEDRVKAARQALFLDPKPLAKTPEIEGQIRDARNRSDINKVLELEKESDALRLAIDEKKTIIDERKYKSEEGRKLAANARASRFGEASNADAIITELLADDNFSNAFGKVAATTPDLLKSQATIDTQAKVKQIVGLIGLEARQKLKGSGTISDSEAKQLSESSTLLANPLISDAVARKELGRVQKVFQGAAKRNSPSQITKAVNQALKDAGVTPPEVEIDLTNATDEELAAALAKAKAQ